MGTFRTLSRTDLEEIVALFPSAKPAGAGLRAATPIPVGTVNTNYALEVEVPAGQDGRRFLRINEGKARDDVAREAAIVGHLGARGVRTPQPFVSHAGEAFAEWRDSFVSLFPWAPGRTLARGEVGPIEADSAGRALAQMHVAGADYADHRPGRYEPEEIDRRLAIIRARAGGDPALAEAVAILAPTLATLARRRVSDLPLGLIHGDLFIDNVLYDGPSLSALLDFEQASWGRLAYDLGVSVLAFGFGSDASFRPAVTRAFIDGYRAVRAPSALEDRAFADELRFACCRFAVTRITDVYLRRDQGAAPGKDYRRYLVRLAAIEQALPTGLLSLV